MLHGPCDCEPAVGLEPTTSEVQAPRSYLLSYAGNELGPGAEVTRQSQLPAKKGTKHQVPATCSRGDSNSQQPPPQDGASAIWATRTGRPGPPLSSRGPGLEALGATRYVALAASTLAVATGR